jgi:galactokinase
LNHHFSVGEDSPASVNLLVTGSVPAGSGLSSSAAMVVASTLAFLAVNGKVRTHFGFAQIIQEKSYLIGS